MHKKPNLIIALTTGLVLAKSSYAAPTALGAPAAWPDNAAGTAADASPSSSDGSNVNAAAPTSPGYNPANDNPALYHGLPYAMPEGLMQEPQSLWAQDTLLGDPWGWRTKLNNHGLEFTPVYIGEVMGNPSGGMKQGIVYSSCLNLPLTVYLDKVADGWSGGVIYANAFWIAGRSLSEDYVGDIGGASNIAGDDTFRVQELWFQQAFWNLRALAKIGLLAADAQFFTSDTSGLFLNGTFGAFTLVGANLPNPPIYPMASPGVSLQVQLMPQFYFQSGVFYGNSGAQDENRNGLDFHWNGNQGALIFSEIGWLANQASGDRGLAGTYKLGSFVHTASFPNEITGAGEGADFGIYGVADQLVYRHDDKTISVFVRGGYAPPDVNTIDWYFDTGFNFTGFVPGRSDDVAGIALGRSNFSKDYSAAQVANGAAACNQETVFEATYKMQVTPWWTLQPDFQYIFNPGGGNGSPDATILGLRTSVTF